jgi:hypothetical protein
MISQYGARNLEENQKIKERKFLTNNLKLENLIRNPNNDNYDFDKFRIICDEETYQKLLSNKDYQGEVFQYWSNISNTSEMNCIMFDKFFKNFKIIKETSEDQFQSIYSNNNSMDQKDFKYKINFKENTFVRMKLTYVDNILVKLTLYRNDESKQKINLAKRPNNKNKYTVNFQFLSQPKYFMPLIRYNRVIGFFCKYGDSQISDVQYDIKEQERDIIIPNNHLETLETIKQLKLRIDMTYFLQGNFLLKTNLRKK